MSFRKKSLNVKSTFSLNDTVHLFGAMSMLGTAIQVLSRYNTTYPIELVILGVACVAQLAIVISPASKWLLIRYIDWFITVPLLVQVISAQSSLPFWVLGLCASVMLLCGFLSVVLDSSSYFFWLWAGFAAQAAFIVLLSVSWENLPTWFLTFFFLWSLYGLVDFIEGPYDNWAQTALDIINKPLFIILLLWQIDPSI